jgi:dephospho-CoA kinase
MMVKGGADQVPPFIALTGGIGAGKSTALAALERLGAAVISTDAVVHELYAADQVRDAVVARFGHEVAPGGVVDRGQLATVAFATAESRAWLEGLIWPLVRERVAAWRTRSEQAAPRPRALVVEVPLLFEAGHERVYDATIAVTADEDVRRDRAGARGHRAVDERDSRQLSQADKAARATYVVANDGDVDELERKLSSMLAMLGV